MNLQPMSADIFSHKLHIDVKYYRKDQACGIPIMMLDWFHTITNWNKLVRKEENYFKQHSLLLSLAAGLERYYR